MNEATNLILSLTAGAFLGAIFFGGLWWTVRRGILSEWPAVWFLCSLLLRTGITVSGFYFVSHGEGKRLVACLVGFLMARLFVTRVTRVRLKEREFVVEGSRT